jgi:hypothetical protein
MYAVWISWPKIDTTIKGKGGVILKSMQLLVLECTLLLLKGYQEM